MVLQETCCNYLYSLRKGRSTGFLDLQYHIFWFNIIFKTKNIKTMQLKMKKVSFMELAFKKQAIILPYLGA